MIWTLTIDETYQDYIKNKEQVEMRIRKAIASALKTKTIEDISITDVQEKTINVEVQKAKMEEW